MKIIKNMVKSMKRKKMIDTAKLLLLSLALDVTARAITTLLFTPRPKPISKSLNQVKEHVSGVMDSGIAKLDGLVNLSKHKFKKHMNDLKVKHDRIEAIKTDLQECMSKLQDSQDSIKKDLGL